jgi:hypothetical protein
MAETEQLTLDADVMPLLRACEFSDFYGQTIMTWERGVIRDIQMHERLRLRAQVKLWIKRALGLK